MDKFWQLGEVITVVFFSWTADVRTWMLTCILYKIRAVITYPGPYLFIVSGHEHPNREVTTAILYGLKM